MPSARPLRRFVLVPRAFVLMLVAVVSVFALSPAASGAAEADETSSADQPDANGTLMTAADNKREELLVDYVHSTIVAERDEMWDRMAQCETGGNWSDPGRWAGGLGIYIGTWLTVGGDEFAPRPDQATREEQIVVAERIAERFGIHAWGCASKIGA